jgi:hypothetical protein
VADKTRNINVNYNIRTVGVDQSRAAVASVEQATQRLQQSAPLAGQKLSSAFQQSTQSVLSMKMQLDRLKTSLELATNPAKIAQLSAQYKALKAQLDATNKSLFEQNKAVKEVTNSTKSLTSGFTGLYSAIKTVLAAGLVREVASVAIEMAKLAGNTESVSTAFNRSFPDSTLLLADLRRATHGTVADFELMQKSLQALNFGIAVNKLPVFLEFAAVRAQQTGVSVDYLVQSIVDGLGRKSILKLDNLGISASRLKDQFNGASLASLSVAQVTEGVAVVVQEELTKMGGYIETSATKVDQLTVAWQELRVELSKRFEEGGFVTQLTELVDSYQAALEAQRRGISVQELFEERQRQEIAQMGVRISLQFALTGEREKDIKVIEDQITALTKSIGAWTKYRDVQNDLIIEQKEERESLILGTDGIVMTGKERQKQIKILEDQIALNIRLRDSNKENVLIDQESLKLLQAKLLALQKSITAGTEPQIETLETLREKLKELKEQIEDTPTSELGIMKSLEQQSEKVQKKIDKILADLYFLGKQTPKIEITITTKPESDLREGIPLASQGLRPDQMTDLLNSSRSDLSGTFEKSKKAAEEFKKALDDLVKTIPELVPPTKYTIDQLMEMVDTMDVFRTRLQYEFKQAREEIINTGFDIVSDQIKATEEIELASLQRQLNNLRNYYDEQKLLAGDNERAKAELRLKEERETAALQKKIAEKDRQARKFSIVIDTATGIMRAFATLPTPAAIVQSAIIAALGASQLAIVSRTPARFKKGGYTGNGGVDQEVGIVHGQEYVTPAQQTKKSFGLLEAIKNNRIDDRVLRGLQLTDTGVKVVPWNNKPVVDAINSNKPPDIITIGRQMYKVFKDRDGNKRYIRSKSM